MKEDLGRKSVKGLYRLAIAILAMGIDATPAVHAKPRANKNADKAAKVVARIELSGSPATRMLLVKKDSKEYLLLGFGPSSGVAILDVSEPSQRRTIETAAGAAGAPAAELKVVADTLTVFGTSEAESTASSGPEEIRSLSGVTAFLRDKAEGLIYATNGDGLWILKAKRRTDVDDAFDYTAGGG